MNVEQKITTLLYMVVALIVLVVVLIFVIPGKNENGRYVCKDISWSISTYTIFDTKTGRLEVRSIDKDDY